MKQNKIYTYSHHSLQFLETNLNKFVTDHPEIVVLNMSVMAIGYGTQSIHYIGYIHYIG